MERKSEERRAEEKRRKERKGEEEKRGSLNLKTQGQSSQIKVPVKG